MDEERLDNLLMTDQAAHLKEIERLKQSVNNKVSMVLETYTEKDLAEVERNNPGIM